MKRNRPATLKKKYWREIPDIIPTGDRRHSGGRASIHEHEGKKYLRRIYSTIEKGKFIEVDVYAVIKAFKIEDGPIAHAIKKLLCAGTRGKGDKKADLVGVLAAVNRAIDQLEEDEIDPPNLEDDGDG